MRRGRRRGRRTSRRRRRDAGPRSAATEPGGGSVDGARVERRRRPCARERRAGTGRRSEAKTRPAPKARASAMVNSPTGPQPSTATVLPARSACSTAKTALPNGSWRVAISGGSLARSFCQTTDSGMATYSANPPSRSTPRIRVLLAHVRAARAAMEAAAAGHVALGGDVVAGGRVADGAPGLDDRAAELVAERQRAARRGAAPTRPSDRCAGRCRRRLPPRRGRAPRRRAGRGPAPRRGRAPGRARACAARAWSP